VASAAFPGGSANTYSVALGDVNGDGFLDVVVGNLNQENQLLLQTTVVSNGQLVSNGWALPFVLPGGSATSTRSILLHDVNKDGFLDVVVGNVNQENQLLLQTTVVSNGQLVSNGWALPFVLPGGSANTLSMALGGLNNDDGNDDGFVDIVVGNSDGENQLLRQTSADTWESAILPGGSANTQSISLGDVNNDGRLDIVVGNLNQENQLLLQAADGSFNLDFNFPNSGTETTLAVALGDVDNDGRLDLVVGNQGANELYLQTRNLGWTKSSDADFPGGIDEDSASVALGDMIKDGLLDVVVGNLGQANELLLHQPGMFPGRRLGALHAPAPTNDAATGSSTNADDQLHFDEPPRHQQSFTSAGITITSINAVKDYPMINVWLSMLASGAMFAAGYMASRR